MVNSQPEDKVSKIMEAAQKRFAHFGLDKTSMNDIAGDLGVSKASLYYYFTDKESLFERVIQKEIEEFKVQIEGKIAAQLPGEKLLVTYLKRRLNYMKVLINLSKLNAESLKSVKPLFTRLAEQFKVVEIDLISRIFKQGIQKGEFEKVSVPEYANLFISLMQGLRSTQILRKGIGNLSEVDYKDMEKQLMLLTKIFIKSLRIQNEE